MSKKNSVVDQIAIAVRSIEESLDFYQNTLGLPLLSIETVESEGVRVAILDAHPTHIELLEPLDESSPIHRFIQKRGEGLHHIAFRSDDLNKSKARLMDRGIRTIEPFPRPGAQGCQVGFIHPKSVNGVLVELIQKPEAMAEGSNGS